MELKSLRCPNCDASLDIEDGLDTFFCKYCGYKIVLEGQSDAAYEAKVRVKEMAHKERLQDKRDAQKRLKMEAKEREEKRSYVFIFLWFGLAIVLVAVMNFLIDGKMERAEEKLEATVEQIMVDIENEDFASAYVKANTLYWDEGLSSDGVEKWDATREEVIRQIEEAEKRATGETADSSEDDDGGLFGWFK